MLKTLYGLELSELEGWLKTGGYPAYRAKQILSWIYEKHIHAFEEARNLPGNLIDQLKREFNLCSLELEKDVKSENQESRKFLFRTPDGRYLESVLIVQRDRRTICVSTQLGCKVGCVFCASGKGKFGRNLTAGEIVEQVAWIERAIGCRTTNVVFMGMGEPLDNFEATLKALKIFQAPWGFGLGARRITVSTSGITPKILDFVKRNEGRVRLSVSLHSSDDRKRTELVPINKRYPLKDLEATLRKVHRVLKREITFEYTLLAGVNDSMTEALGVARMAKPLKAKVNLIPYNPIRDADFKRPAEKDIEKFRATLERHGVRVMVRQTAGRDIDAACGQLRLDRETSP